LVDQWLDVLTCDFEAAVSAIVVARDGKEVDAALVTEDVHKFLKVVEAHLTGRKFLVGDELSIADLSIAAALNVVFSTLLGEEERKAYQNLTTWYLGLVATDATIGSKDLPK
jgi:glutathione S-transferase